MGKNIFISVLTQQTKSRQRFMTIYTSANGGKSVICLQRRTIYSGCHSNTDDRQMKCLYCTRKMQLYTDRILQNKLYLLLALVSLHKATPLLFSLTPELVSLTFRITA